jgi:hypothetical protein
MPCSWGFEFFSPGVPAVFLREGVLDMLLLARECGANYFFSCLNMGAGVPVL